MLLHHFLIFLQKYEEKSHILSMLQKIQMKVWMNQAASLQNTSKFHTRIQRDFGQIWIWKKKKHSPLVLILLFGTFIWRHNGRESRNTYSKRRQIRNHEGSLQSDKSKSWTQILHKYKFFNFVTFFQVFNLNTFFFK